MMKMLVIKRFCFPVTLRCNLRCRLCAERSPYYEKPYHPPLSGLTEQIGALFRTVDRVEQFDITGGEPLLRGDLDRFIAFVYEQYGDRIGRLRLTTNGTLCPRDGLIDQLKRWDQRAFMIVDRYPLSTKYRETAGIFTAAGIPYEVRDYTEALHCDGWVDYGDFSKKHTPLEAKALFDACMIPKLDFFLCLVDGKLFPCAKARLLYEQGITKDFLDICGDTVPEEKSEELLRRFLKSSFLKSCMFCNGLCEDSPRFKPAEQLIR